MTNLDPLPSPRISHSLRLRCPHCGIHPIRSKHSWFETREGCPHCHYRYIREQGYFTGAAWVITYTFGALLGIFIGALFLIVSPETPVFWISTVAASVAGAASFAFVPLGKALWLYVDHLLHPLEAHEREF